MDNYNDLLDDLSELNESQEKLTKIEEYKINLEREPKILRFVPIPMFLGGVFLYILAAYFFDFREAFLIDLMVAEEEAKTERLWIFAVVVSLIYAYSIFFLVALSLFFSSTKNHLRAMIVHRSLGEIIYDIIWLPLLYAGLGLFLFVASATLFSSILWLLPFGTEIVFLIVILSSIGYGYFCFKDFIERYYPAMIEETLRLDKKSDARRSKLPILVNIPFLKS